MMRYLAGAASEGRLPGRQHIDPIDLRRVLTLVNLVDVEREAGEFRFRFRLVGERQRQAAGRNITGLLVEDAKIALSEADAATIGLGFIEDELASETGRQSFDSTIAAKIDQLYRTAARCVADAGLKPDAVRTVFLTGGSSRVPAVREAIARATPEARIAAGSDLLSVALGLTRQAARFG